MPKPRKVQATITSVDDFGRGVYSVRMVVPKSSARFHPGQFTHLTIDPFDPSQGYWPESRVFSLASRPKTDEIRIIYSVKGRYTERMRQYLAEGQKVWLKLPYGDFIIEKGLEPNRPIILIAGGTGIAPYIPYLLDEANAMQGRSVSLFYGVRDPSLLIFDDELKEAENRMDGLRIFLYSEEHSDDRLFSHGRISYSDILEEGRRLGKPVYFISGPPAM
jgi:ferredoxin-NADP reductase